MNTDRLQKRILIVEDEEKLSSLLRDYLRREGFEVEIFERGDRALAAITKEQPDLVLLDLMLPGMDGLTLCREIRKFSELPIIMITARVEEIDRLLGLELGADDYICKPYSPREVVARVKNVLRRLERTLSAGNAESLLSDGERRGPLNIDTDQFTASYAGRFMELTPVEFRLLRALTEHPGRVFSREQLLGHMYDDHRLVSERTIDSHIKNLRRKLLEASGGIPLIQSVYGVGYKFELRDLTSGTSGTQM